jgi:hypothetical protein
MEGVGSLVPSSGWFAVRCVFRNGWPTPAPDQTGHDYEERITIWRASSAEEAIAKAEAEAEAYAATIEEAPGEFLGLSQSYELFDNPETEGAEVFSLLRRSVLEPDDYLNAFFATGDERITESLDTPPTT